MPKKLLMKLNVLSLTLNVTDWLANSRRPRILHVFDHACNLINKHREVLSIVTPPIGNGPFNLVIKDDICFSEHLNIESTVSIHDNQLTLGNLIVNTVEAKLWRPCPDWEMLHAKRDHILSQLLSLPISAKHPIGTTCQPSLSTHLLSTFSTSIAIADLNASLSAAKQLSGLGAGLTPAGDDVIMGAIYAAWIIHPPEIARVLAEEISKAAAPLTTSLSAVWLRSAGRGEAGILWHDFFEALLTPDPFQIQSEVNKILAVGATSGADALAGFIGVFSCLGDLANTGIH